MHIGVLGTGPVGHAMGRGFLALGHSVTMGARRAGNEKALAFVAEQGDRASQGSFAEAVSGADIVVFATLGMAIPEVVAAVGPAAFAGKLVLDTTNPLDFSEGFPPQLGISGHDSAGETLQRLLPEAKVVKAFNTVGNAHYFRPQFAGGPPDMFIAGNDPGARADAARIVEAFGWNVVDLGDLTAARYMEAMCIAWVRACATDGNWNRAFKLLSA